MIKLYTLKLVRIPCSPLELQYYYPSREPKIYIAPQGILTILKYLIMSHSVENHYPRLETFHTPNGPRDLPRHSFFTYTTPTLNTVLQFPIVAKTLIKPTHASLCTLALPINFHPLSTYSPYILHTLYKISTHSLFIQNTSP